MPHSLYSFRAHQWSRIKTYIYIYTMTNRDTSSVSKPSGANAPSVMAWHSALNPSSVNFGEPKAKRCKTIKTLLSDLWEFWELIYDDSWWFMMIHDDLCNLCIFWDLSTLNRTCAKVKCILWFGWQPNKSGSSTSRKNAVGQHWWPWIVSFPVAAAWDVEQNLQDTSHGNHDLQSGSIQDSSGMFRAFSHMRVPDLFVRTNKFHFGAFFKPYRLHMVAKQHRQSRCLRCPTTLFYAKTVSNP